MIDQYFYVKCEKRINRGRKKLAEYLADVDEDKVKFWMAEQVELVGGKLIYDIVDENLKSGVIELSLLEETCNLYGWRMKFFRSNLPVGKGSWFTDTYSQDLVHFQVANNFDQVVRIVCSKLREGKSFPTGLFLESDNDIPAREARNRMDSLRSLFHAKGHHFWREYWLNEEVLEGLYLHFSDVVKVIIEHYSKAPRRLEEITMTFARKLGVSLDQMTRPVLCNNKVGFYALEDDMPEHLTEEGQELYKRTQTLFIKIRNNPTLLPPPRR